MGRSALNARRNPKSEDDSDDGDETGVVDSFLLLSTLQGLRSLTEGVREPTTNCGVGGKGGRLALDVVVALVCVS